MNNSKEIKFEATINDEEEDGEETKASYNTSSSFDISLHTSKKPYIYIYIYIKI